MFHRRLTRVDAAQRDSVWLTRHYTAATLIDTMARVLMHFTERLGVLFADGFETRDTSAWSATVP